MCAARIFASGPIDPKAMRSGVRGSTADRMLKLLAWWGSRPLGRETEDDVMRDPPRERGLPTKPGYRPVMKFQHTEGGWYLLNWVDIDIPC